MFLKHQKQIDLFYKWKKEREILVEQLEVTESKKLNLLSLSEDEFDRVTDQAYDDLQRIKF